jgi:hypothetical protein
MSSTKHDTYSSFLGEGITGDLEVKVWSTSMGEVVYALQDPKVHRSWKSGEVKILTFHEVYQLANSSGGMPLLANHLQIRDPKVRKALQLPMEPEYLYTDEDARKLVNSGTEEEILDAIEFGPRSLAAAIRYYAILDIDSLEKMKFFNNLFRMNIQQIRDNLKDDGTETTVENTSKRRVKKDALPDPIDTEPKKTRKTKALEPSEPREQVPTE